MTNTGLRVHRRPVGCIFPKSERTRLGIEVLEQRIAPAAISWVGGDGNWNDPSKWSGGVVPAAGDDVTINPASAAFTVTVNDAQAAHSLSMPGDDHLTLTGSLTLAANSTLHDLALSGNGSLVANAPTGLTGSSSLADQGALGGSSVITNLGTLVITSGDPNIRTEVRNSGMILHGNAYLDFDDPNGKVRVLAGGVYEVASSAGDFGFRQFNGGKGISVEAGGTFRENSPNGSRFLTNTGNLPAFSVSDGTIDVVNGTLGVNTGGTWKNVTVKVANGQALDFLNGSDITLDGTFEGSGAGVVRLRDNGSLSAAATGASLNFPGSMFQWSDQSYLRGPGILTNLGAITITGGDPNLETELRDPGTITHGNAYLDFNAATGNLRVLTGGVYEVANSASDYGFRQFNGGKGISVEAGATFRENSPNGSRFLTNTGNLPAFSVADGTIDVVKGTLGVNTGGTWKNVTVKVANGQALDFLNGSDITLDGTFEGSGAGVVRLRENGSLSAAATGASLNFPGSMFQWSDQSFLRGPGILTNLGAINITGGDPNLETELRNPGTITQGNAYLDFNAATGKLRVLSGGVYTTVNTVSDYGFRQFNGGQGISVEAGGIFRHNSPTGTRFLANTGNAPNFSVTNGMVDVVNGTLGINTPGIFTEATLQTATNGAVSFLNGSNITVNGTLRGTGDGTVNLAESGLLSIGAGGATFDFPAGVFQWKDQSAITGPGVLKNVGVLAITGGDPNLRTELQNEGIMSQGNAYFDFDAAEGKLRVVAGGLYQAANTVADYGLRQFNGGQGISVETGGTFRLNSPTAVRYFTNTGNAPDFSVTGGLIDIVSGTLGMSTGGTWSDATVHVALGQALDFLNGSDVKMNGTFTGAGAGAVRLRDSGSLSMGAAGVTFNLPGTLFQWGDQSYLRGPGVLTNLGNITITGGDPNLETELRNSGTITQGNAYLDLNAATGKLRVLDGGVYTTTNTNSDYGFRQFNGGQGIFVEAGGTFRHNSATGARFLTNTGNNPSFNVTGGKIEVRGGNLGINSSGSLTDATISVAAGAELNFYSGADVTIRGAITGSGGGGVGLRDSGILRVAAEGATFGFAPGMFHWSDQAAIAGPGVLTNVGEMQITGGDPNLRTELQNKGTMVQGNAYFDFDDAGGKLRVLNGGIYTTANTVSDYGLRQFNGGQGVSIEAGGIFRHNSPNGSRFLTDTGNAPQFSNTGSVEVVKGTLYFNGPVSQLSGPNGSTALSAGSWEVKSGAALQFNISGIASIAAGASVTVGGNGGFTGLASLTSNAGTLKFLQGADLTTTGGFTNSGVLVLSPGTIFSSQSYTQTATGSVEFQVGGPAAGQTGKLAVTNTAVLAGTAKVGITGGFGSVAGQKATLMTYASHSGAFTTVDGLTVNGTPYFEADTGATSVTLTTIHDAADLRPEAISGPASGFLGLPVTVSFTVRNLQNVATLASSWVDAVYLSKDGLLDDSDVRIGGVPHSGGLAANGSYSASLTAPLPAAVAGDYHLLVVVDENLELPDSDRVNNAVSSQGTINADLEHLSHGVTKVTTIKPGQSLYYQLDEPAGRDVLLTASVGTAGGAKFFAKLNGIPTTTSFDLSATSLTDLQQKLAILGTAEQPYVLLIQGTDAAGAAGTGVSLSTRELGFEIVGTSPGTLPNVGTQQITITGSHFTSNSVVRLVDSLGTQLVPTSVVLQDSHTLVAKFALGTVKLGLYDVRVTDSGAVTETDDVLQVLAPQVNHSGLIGASEHWLGGLVHYVTSSVTVPAGVTVTIDPGAIVKFGSYAGMQVDSGGSLIAAGTLAQPIIFTSLRDDANGGDTNRDGASTKPSAGDWGTMSLNGTGVFDHTELLYGGGSPSGSWSATAALRTYSGNLTFTNSAIQDAFFDGLLAWGGTVTVENSVFVRNDRAISAHPGSPVLVKNSTFDDNRIALLTHGGSLTVANSIVFNSIESGIQYDFGTFVGATNTDVFSTVTGSQNYRNTTSLTGTNGNISVDPKFKNPQTGDYRLNFLSPAIDAASGALAPATDAHGLARYDDPRTVNKGVGTPSFADMGALEFVENEASPLDLVVTSVAGRPVLTGGAVSHVEWTVQNRGTDVVHGAWHDTLQLVSNDGTVVLDSGAFLSETTLGPGQSATFGTDVIVPFGTEGQYRWQVKTNSDGAIFEGANSDNNLGVASERSALQIPTLTVGGTSSGNFSTVGGGLLYKVHPTPGSDVRISVDRADAGLTELFLGVGQAPTTTNFFSHVTPVGDPNATIEISDALDTDYYILVAPRTLPTGATTFALSSVLASFQLDSLGVTQGSNTGKVTIPIEGSQFGADLTAQIIPAHGRPIAATAVRVDSSTLAYATFDLTDFDPGAYDVSVTSHGQTDKLDHAFSVVAGTAGDQVRAHLILPDRVRSGRIFTAYLEYTNTGLTDALAPVITLSSATGNLLRLESSEQLSSSVSFLAYSPDGDAGILRPGETVRLPFEVQAIAGRNTINPAVSVSKGTPFDFAALKEALRPDLAAPAFDALFESVVHGTRSTDRDYIELLSDAETLFAKRTGAPSHDFGEVLSFLVEDAFIDQHTKIRGHVYLQDSLHPANGVAVTATNLTDGTELTAVSTADGLVRFIELPAGLAAPGDLPPGATLPVVTVGKYRIGFEDVLPPASLSPVEFTATGVVQDPVWIVQPGGEISGRATLPAGVVPDPALGTGMILARNLNGATYARQIAEDGSYDLKGLPDGTYSVSLLSGGKFASPIPFDGLVIKDGQVVALDDLVGTPGGTIKGKVTSSGGAPLAGVRVSVADEGNPVAVITDANGLYELDHVRSGPHMVVAGLTDYIVQTLSGVPVSENATTSGQDITLSTYGSISGTVTSGGNPVAGVAIEVDDATGAVISFDRTDANGHYRLPSLNGGVFTFVADGMKFGRDVETLTLAAAENQTHNVVLQTASFVGGFVHQAGTDAPFENVIVQLVTPTGDIISDFTDASGNYSFARMPAGHYSVMLPDGSNRHEFDVAGPSSNVSINFTVDFGTISGTVELADGTTPNPHGTVVLLKDGQVMFSAPVGADGAYHFALISPGSYDVAVTDGVFDYATKSGVTVTGGHDTAVTAFVPGTASLHLKIADAAGQPEGVTGFASLTQLSLPSSVEKSNLVVVPPSGVVDVSNLSPGQYLLSVLVPGLAEVKRIVTINPGANTMTANSAAASTLSGVITDGAAGVAGLDLIAYDPANPKIHWEVSTDATGHYSFASLPAGNYALLVADNRPDGPGTHFAGKTINGVALAVGATTMQNATLVAANITVAGQIADGSLHRPTGGVVYALNADGVKVAEATIDVNGNYSFKTLAPGTYTISGEAYGFVIDGKTVTVAAGQTPAVALTAHWYVDPGSDGILGFIDGIISSTFDLVLHGAKEAVKLVLQPPEPSSELGFPPFSWLPPNCDCPEARVWYQRALRDDAQAKAKFQQLLEQYDADVIGSGLVEGGLFAVKLTQYVSSLVTTFYAGPLQAAKSLAQLQKVEQSIFNFEKNAGAGLLSPETYKELGAAYNELASRVTSLFTASNAVGTLSGGINATVFATTGDTSNFGTTVVDVVNDAKAFIEKPSKAKFLVAINTAAGFGTQMTGLISAARAFRGLFAPIAPAPLLDYIDAILNGVQLFVTASQGLQNVQDELNLYAQTEDQYSLLIKNRNVDFQRSVRAITQCIINCKEEPKHDPPKPPHEDPQPPDDTDGRGSFDPNDKLTTGFGAEHFVNPGATLPYSILFENTPTATAPAQVVTVSDQLSPKLDWSTVQLGDIGFNGVTITVPAGLTHFETTVNVASDPNPVHVVGDFNPGTGKLTWTMSSVDPTTGGLPADPLAGFLPPDNAQHAGEGFVNYLAKARTDLANADTITNQATIVFDVNAPINTPMVSNTIDTATPVSSVAVLPASSVQTSFLVSWSGTDAGSGIAGYDVFVSDNGGAYSPFQLQTSDTSAMFTGQLGHTYHFYSQAIDHVGNVEAAPAIGDTLTSVGMLVPVAKQNFSDADGTSYTIKLTGHGTAQIIQDADGGIGLLKLSGTDAKSSVTIAVKGKGGDGKVALGGVLDEGALGSLIAPHAVLSNAGVQISGTLGKLVLGDVQGGADITFGGTAANKSSLALGAVDDGSRVTTGSVLTSVKATSFGEGRITAAALNKLATTAGAMDADLAITGAVGSVTIKGGGADVSIWSGSAFGSISVIGGAFDPDVDSTGAISKIAVKGGGLTGHLTAKNFGAVSIAGGDLSGLLTSSAPAATLGKTAAMKSLAISGGDLTGDIDLLGALGALHVQASKGGAGGSVNSATVTAAKIASIVVGKNLSASLILAGAHLGSDLLLGGSGGSSDTFGGGSIGAVSIGGGVIASTLAAGLNPTDGVSHNGNDAIIGGKASVIASILVKGQADAASYFAAGQIKGSVKIGGQKIVPTTDPHFFVGS